MKAPFAALKGVRVRATRMCCTLCRQVSLSQHDLSRLGGSLRSGVNFINRDDSGGTGWATLTRRTCSVKQSALFSHSAQNIRISVERSLNYYSFAFSSPKRSCYPLTRQSLRRVSGPPRRGQESSSRSSVLRDHISYDASQSTKKIFSWSCPAACMASNGPFACLRSDQ